MDEAITTGIASHSLSAIPGILRHDGSPPLFYVLLHFWIRAFGDSEAATHSLSLLFGLLTIPVGMWAGWSLFGRRAGMYAATLFAFSTFLTQYAGETRMYELMGLLGLIATAAFIHAFIYRRRKYLIVFAVNEALMLYRLVSVLFRAAEFLLLQSRVGAHSAHLVRPRQFEHAQVQGVETGQGDELELVAHRPELGLEALDGGVVQLLLPVE